MPTLISRFCLFALLQVAAVAWSQEPAASATPPDAAPIPAPILTGTASPSDSIAPPTAEQTPAPPPKKTSAISIEIDLRQQKAYLLHDNHKVYESPISSGRARHLTVTGDFEVVEKDLNHFSSLYGKIVEKGSGRVVVTGADAAMPVPHGCKFVPAPMKYFMRFDGAAGMHAGVLPGYAASHGCVRMPLAKAKLFYETVEIGSPVHVFGTTPTRESRPTRVAQTKKSDIPKVVVSEPPAAPAPEPRRKWWPF